MSEIIEKGIKIFIRDYINENVRPTIKDEIAVSIKAVEVQMDMIQKRFEDLRETNSKVYDMFFDLDAKYHDIDKRVDRIETLIKSTQKSHPTGNSIESQQPTSDHNRIED